MLAASNTSVRNSTAPPIPAGSPASVQRLGQRKRQIHAGGVGVDRQRGDLQITQRQPGGGIGAVLPGRFCQANITWTSG